MEDVQNEVVTPPSIIFCVIGLIGMLLSGAFHQSISGAVQTLLALYLIFSWSLNYKPIETSRAYYVISIIFIIADGILVVFSGLFKTPLLSGLLNSLKIPLSICGVQTFNVDTVVGISAYCHYFSLILTIVSGLFYIQIAEIHREPLLTREPSLGTPSLQPLLETIEENKGISVEMSIITPLDLSMIAPPQELLPSHLNNSALHKHKESATLTFGSTLLLILKEYFINYYFFLYACQIMTLVWTLRYNSFWTIPQLLWLMYSTLNNNVNALMFVTKNLYFPYLIIYFTVLYGVNIKEIPLPQDNIDFWRNIGILVFHSDSSRHTSLDFLLMLFTLVAFCVALRFRTYYDSINSILFSETKQQPHKFKRVFIRILQNVDKCLIVWLYFRGLERINILHTGMIAFFLLMLIYPVSGRRCFKFLLIYLEVFYILMILYGICSIYVSSSSTLQTIGAITGVYVELFKESAINRVNISNYFLFTIILVYLQHKIYSGNIYSPTSQQAESEEEGAFGTLIGMVIEIKNLFNWLYIYIAYVVFLGVIVSMSASIINFGFLVLVLLAATVHLWNDTHADSPGLKVVYLRPIWIIILLYCGVIVLSLYVFQFGGITTLKLFLNVFYAPSVFSESAEILGFEQYQGDDRWEMFLPYFALLFLSVIASRELHSLQENDENKLEKRTVKIDSTIYFLRKLKLLWGLFDFLSANCFELLCLIVLVLAIYWQLSIASAILLVIVCCYFFKINTIVYSKMTAKKIEGELGPAEVRNLLEENSIEYKEQHIKLRISYWKYFYIFCIIFLLLAYLSRFIEVIFTKQLFFNGSENYSIFFRFDIIRFLSLALGFYHSEYSQPRTFFFDSLGYFLLFVMLMIEKKGIQWYYNRMKADIIQEEEVVKETTQTELHSHCFSIEELLKYQSKQKEQETGVVDLDEKDVHREFHKLVLIALAIQIYKIVYKSGSELAIYHYKYLIKKALKNLLEDVILLFVLISCVLKQNVMVLMYLFFVLAVFRYGTSLKVSIWLNGYFIFLLGVQYFLSILTMSDSIAPQSQYYPYINKGCSAFVKTFDESSACPFYLYTESWNDWATYFSLGKQSNPLAYLVLDVIILELFSIYFKYFNHQTLEMDILSLKHDDSEPSPEKEENKKGWLAVKQRINKLIEKRNKIKNFLHAFCSIMEQALFLYLHIVILLVILILSTKSNGLFAVGYMVFCLSFLYQNVTFAINYTNWKYPFCMRYILQPFLFVDIVTQLIIQMPISGTSTFWIIIKIIQPEEIRTIIIMKVIIFSILSLQGKIFFSGEFSRFVNEYTTKSVEIREIKGKCCTYIYNNKRVHKYKKYDELKQLHREKLENIKQKIEEWNEKLVDPRKSQSIIQLHRMTSFRSRHRSSIGVTSPRHLQNDPAQKIEEINMILNNEKLLRKQAIEHHSSLLGKFYLWLHSLINHIIFKNNNKLNKLFKTTARGKYIVQSRLEKMLIEKERTKLILEKKNIEKNTEGLFELEESPKFSSTVEKLKSKYKNIDNQIMSFVKCRHIFKHYWMCIYRILFSSTQMFVYLFMILAHLFNGSILTVPYPLSVFLYAMIEHCRPKKQYWTIMLLYTEFVLALKFIIQLKLITSWIISQQQFNDFFVNEYRVGLKIFDSVSSSNFFIYTLFECLIIFGILIHQYVLVFLGIYDKREIEQESIFTAIDRICNIQPDTPPEETPSEEESNSLHSGDSSDQLLEQNELLINEEEQYIPPESDRTDPKKEEEEIPINSLSMISMNTNFSSGPPKPSKNIFFNILSYITFRNPYCSTLFPILKIEKPGYDYNNKIMYLQLFIAVYLIFFYARMTADYENISVALSFTQFSGEMIIVLLFHIGVILLERFLYLKDFSDSGIKPRRFEVILQRRGIQPNPSSEGEDLEGGLEIDMEDLDKCIYQSFKSDYSETYNYGLFLKYLMQIILTCTLLILIFWYFPNIGNKKLIASYVCRATDPQCNEATSNVWIAIFYLLFCLYFTLSSFQIKYGYPEIRNSKTIRKKANKFGANLIKLYRRIPLLLELYIVMDWAFTKTSLGIWQWFKFDDIYSSTYLSKNLYNKYKKQGLGRLRAFCDKFLISSIGLTVGLGLLVGPMIIFSSLNPLSSTNNIVGASVKFGIYVSSKNNYYELFSTTQAVKLSEITSERFDQEGLNTVDEIKAADLDTVQTVTLQLYADTEWSPTEQAKDRLINYLNSGDEVMKFYLDYSFNRNYNAEYAAISHPIMQEINTENRLKIHKSLSTCNNFTILLKGFYKKVVRLPTSSRPVIMGEDSDKVKAVNITLQLNCSQVRILNDEGYIYFRTYNWGLYEGEEGLEFITWSDKITSVILGYSALTLYISVVIVFGNLLKSFTRGESFTIIVQEMPDPQELLNLCEGVIIYRMENNMQMEGELYYTLIDIFRSPELLKIVTGGSLNYLKSQQKT